MFDYQVSKHPHFDEACRVFALRHNLVQLAERAGMNVQILRNKLNPAQPHLLTAPDIWLLTDLTEDSTLVDGFLAQIHCLPCVPINEVARETATLRHECNRRDRACCCRCGIWRCKNQCRPS